MTNCSALLRHIDSALDNHLETYLYLESPAYTTQTVKKMVENYLHSLNTVQSSKVRCTIGSDLNLYIDIDLQFPVAFTTWTPTYMPAHDYYDHKTFV